MIEPETIQVGQSVLVSCDNWFYAPDGKQYRAVFGIVHGVHTAEATLSVRPNGRSTNWYLQIGNMIIAGCQVHYVIQTHDVTEAPMIADWQAHEGRAATYERPNSIYRAVRAAKGGAA